jgi:Phage tail assembly chaperone protein
MQLWQLKKLSTGESLSEPQTLPDNWGPIFGLSGFIDKIGELSWVHESYADMGWVQVEGTLDTQPTVDQLKESMNAMIEKLLSESVEYILPDNNTITKGKLQEWLEYRRLLKNIPNQVDFPNKIEWPAKPN